MSKRYKDNIVIDALTFQLPREQITTILGRNGAGKTTLVDIITGVLKADYGVLLHGKTIDNYNKGMLESNKT